MTTPVWTTRNAHNGNRWWVAYNTNQGVNANLYSPSGYESIGSGNATDDAIFAKAPQDGKTTVSVQNVTWLIFGGPYPSYAASQTALAALQKTKPAPSTVQSAANSAVPGLGTAAGAFSDIGHGLTAFFGAITNYRMWRSLGWLLLGLVLVISSAAWLIKGELTKSVIPGIA